MNFLSAEPAKFQEKVIDFSRKIMIKAPQAFKEE
jgi:hypothetical protein